MEKSFKDSGGALELLEDNLETSQKSPGEHLEGLEKSWRTLGESLEES